VPADLPPYDPSVTWVRHCDRCGHIDDSERWETRDDGLRATENGTGWRCPACGNDRAVVKLAAKLAGG
jgi:hypothetical protein